MVSSLAQDKHRMGSMIHLGVIRGEMNIAMRPE